MTADLARSWLTLSAPVAAAQAAGRPLVALESTIIAHGMPYPENVRTARAVEASIRALGAEPATIAIIGGRIRIGLADEELELLGRSGQAAKVSRRDLPAVLAGGGLGATTVAGTMICAALAGIEVFVTGGIGGVHRGAQETFDISADLQELAKTSVAVVCAGAKSILDLGLTLEYLETHGVPVLSCEQDNFAAFYTRDSGFRADYRLDDPAQQARFIRTKWDLGLAGGVVLSTPVPAAAAMARAEIDALTGQALAEAREQGITGKAVTPFLLDRIKALTGGRSLATNIALVQHNAQVGARLALALAGTPRVVAQPESFPPEDRSKRALLNDPPGRFVVEAGWTTATAHPESGTMRFVATEPGSAMDGATVTIASNATEPAGFVDVTFASPSGRTEHWRGLPRSLGPFEQVVAGSSVSDPADPLVLAGGRVYYDARASRPAAYLPIAGNPNAAGLALVSLQVARLPLSGVEFSGSGSALTATFRFTAPRWQDRAVAYTWPNLPANVHLLLETLRGANPSYAYRQAGASTVKAWCIAARSPLRGARRRVTLFASPDVARIHSIGVADGSAAHLCTVTLSLDDRGNRTRAAAWRDVARAQGPFATTLEGSDAGYDYANGASGDWKPLGALLTIVTDGDQAAGEVENLAPAPAGHAQPDDDLRVWGSLVSAFLTAPVGTAEVLAPIARAASAFQQAIATEGGTSRVIESGSLMFRAMPVTVPTGGSVGLLNLTAGT